MNKNRPIRTPRFVIAESELSTVDNSNLNDFHDLMILKIRNNLKALRTDNPPFPAGSDISTKLIITMKQSKILNPSATYFLHPNPNYFSNISNKKINVKK